MRQKCDNTILRDEDKDFINMLFFRRGMKLYGNLEYLFQDYLHFMNYTIYE